MDNEIHSKDLKQYCLVRFTKAEGKINKTLEGTGCALLKFWALQNTTSNTFCMVFEKDSGKIMLATEGVAGAGFPRIADGNKRDLGNIEKYCPGILEAIKD